MILVRQEIGDVLRDFRLQKGRTLRQVASKASVALGYLSEVERGEKEASSELLGSICRALDLPLSQVLSDVADRVSMAETTQAQIALARVPSEGLATPIRVAASPALASAGDVVTSAA